MITVDEEVSQMMINQGMSLEDCPARDQVIVLRHKSNASAGGDTIDVTEEISPAMKVLAINAIRAIPAMSHGGVDILVDDAFGSSTSGTVIEINAAAELGLHLYPWKGRSRFVPADIVDLYFPETRRPAQDEAFNWFFDLKSMKQSLSSGLAESITPPPCPVIEDMIGKRIVFHGHVQGVRFRAHVSKIAKVYTIHGTVENEKDGTVIVYAAGTPKNVSEFIGKFGDNPGTARIETMHVEDYAPWKIIPGFHIKLAQKKTLRNAGEED